MGCEMAWCFWWTWNFVHLVYKVGAAVAVFVSVAVRPPGSFTTLAQTLSTIIVYNVVRRRSTNGRAVAGGAQRLVLQAIGVGGVAVTMGCEMARCFWWTWNFVHSCSVQSWSGGRRVCLGRGRPPGSETALAQPCPRPTLGWAFTARVVQRWRRPNLELSPLVAHLLMWTKLTSRGHSCSGLSCVFTLADAGCTLKPLHSKP